ncbi:MAG: hypothetical protein JO279_15445 [Verrucomicrobia bacterium]|nr:hypothetical protein [Verrucomicrobiota bacterium]
MFSGFPPFFCLARCHRAVGGDDHSDTVRDRRVRTRQEPEAARLSGINVRATVYGVYAFSAFASSVAGILYTSRLANGIPTAGEGYELDAIAAAVVGGASLMGGEGTILGTVLGALIIATLRNGGDLLGINPFILQTSVGVLIVQNARFSQRFEIGPAGLPLENASQLRKGMT